MESVWPAVVLAPVSIWFIVIMLKAATYISKRNKAMYVYGGSL